MNHSGLFGIDFSDIDENTVVQFTGLSPPPYCVPLSGTSTGSFLYVINLQFVRCDAIVFAALLLLLKVNAKKVCECTKMMQIYDIAILICVGYDVSFTVKNRQRRRFTVGFFQIPSTSLNTNAIILKLPY